MSRTPQQQQPVTGAAWPTIVAALLPLWLLTYPFDFQSEPVTTWLRDPYPWVGKVNSLSNVLMLIPFGIACGWWLTGLRWRTWMTCVVTTAIAAAISLMGETLQVYLPDRHSSIVDVVANSGGAAIGSIIGCRLASTITARWLSVAAWLAVRPRSRMAVKVLAVTIIARLAPFMFNVETFYLKRQWRETVQNSWPIRFDAAAAGGLALTCILFTLSALALSRAMRETFEQRGDRGSPAGLAIMVCVMLAVITELLQWPIRGRVMDVADVIAAVAGVLLAVAIDALLGPVAGRMR